MKIPQFQHMLTVAKESANHAYCPYSHFPVGAAVLADNETVYAGCNMENASFVSGMCAEGNAVSNAIVHGMKRIKAIVVYTPTELHASPCGNCRQIIREFADEDTLIYSVARDESIQTFTLSELLPHSFTAHNIHAATSPGNKE